MRIFFASSQENEKKSETQKILTTYLKQTYDVFHYLHIATSDDGGYSFTRLMERIGQADIFIGEMSMPSQTLGFQLAHAIQLSKPTLYLYDKREKGPPAGFMGTITSRVLKVKSYDETNHIKVIDAFMTFAQKQLLTARTSFMSTREIDGYLAKESRLQGIPKGELIRQALHAYILNK
ncbi:MAG TPA: hypothetical protein VFT53_03050 [Candidatus Saccharimonadales bacterium]|nr:hypothetical protein [Candidatus Saccharimonadales bacterium]